MTTTHKLETLSAWEIGELVNNREITPTEVVTYFLERIERLNKHVNAFVYVKPEYALSKAKELEKRLDKGEYLGEFAGVPFGLKDFLPDKKGWTSSRGGVKCLVSEDEYNSVFCAAMEAAGGIAIGKTNAPAYGFRGTTDNLMYGPTSTPFNLKYNAGGSSGGSAAAVASGLVPIAEGGDAGGSIRIPASFCNLFGFKAGIGVIPSVCRPDAWSATHPLCCNGGLAKSVKDAAILLNYMNYEARRDPYSLPKTHNFIKETEDFCINGIVFNASSNQNSANTINKISVQNADSATYRDNNAAYNTDRETNVADSKIHHADSATYNDNSDATSCKNTGRQLKIAYTEDFGIFELESEVKDVIRNAAQRFSELGFKVEEYPFKFNHTAKELSEEWCKGITIDCALELNHLRAHGNDLLKNHTEDFPEEFIYWKKITDNMGIEDMYSFNLARTDVLDCFETVFEDYDLIISPTSCVTGVLNANDKNTKGPAEINGKKIEPLIGWTQTFLANFAGYPAASIPAGFAGNGVPVGLQLIAPRHNDVLILQTATLYEKLYDWKRFYPYMA